MVYDPAWAKMWPAWLVHILNTRGWAGLVAGVVYMRDGVRGDADAVELAEGCAAHRSAGSLWKR